MGAIIFSVKDLPLNSGASIQSSPWTILTYFSAWIIERAESRISSLCFESLSAPPAQMTFSTVRTDSWYQCANKSNKKLITRFFWRGTIKIRKTFPLISETFWGSAMMGSISNGIKLDVGGCAQSDGQLESLLVCFNFANCHVSNSRYTSTRTSHWVFWIRAWMPERTKFAISSFS